ncbi:MAG: hypothetical protein WDW38_010956 [Sanguina aurantia]
MGSEKASAEEGSASETTSCVRVGAKRHPVWTSTSAFLRSFEILITYQLYTHFGLTHPTAAFFAVAWNGACIPLSFYLDRDNRKAFAAVQSARARQSGKKNK